jgi:Protein of unknown function (DUF2442)
MLTLSDGSIIERDVSCLLIGPVFARIREDPAFFAAQARTEEGTVVWPNGADLCPDVLIWGGPPPEGDETPVTCSAPPRESRNKHRP